ncbi:MAG TPA: hypothetical protein VGF56_05980 [Rhizomicrobium sp.]|jgi:hypothetical protein
MKFPFEFGVTLVFRLIFPGLVLAVAFLPLATALLDALSIDSAAATTIPALTVVFGWMVVMADQPIYMLYEGRRYWPSFLKKYWEARQRKRLNKLVDLRAELDKPPAQRKPEYKDLKRVEVSFRMLDYALDDDGERTITSPTRMGNLIDAYETYSETSYGMDSIFYWPRIWLAADKDIRDALDQTQAIADSALYVSFSIACAAPLLLFYLVLELLPYEWPVAPVVLPFVPPPGWTALFAAVCLAMAYWVYRVGLYPQGQYGELFKALIDQSLDKLAFIETAVRRAVNEGNDPVAAREESYLTAARYLRWHKIKPPGTRLPGESKTYTPESWKKRTTAP